MELTLQWNDSFTETHAVDEYCVTARGGVCQPEAVCLNPDIIYVCGGLETGRLYEFSVYARNCDNETGFNMSTPLLVSPQGETIMTIVIFFAIAWLYPCNGPHPALHVPRLSPHNYHCIHYAQAYMHACVAQAGCFMDNYSECILIINFII